jgi:hypothetical protein
MDEDRIDGITNSYTAEVKLHNSKNVIIWYTCWPSIKHIVSEIVWIASDFPKNELK